MTYENVACDAGKAPRRHRSVPATPLAPAEPAAIRFATSRRAAPPNAALARIARTMRVSRNEVICRHGETVSAYFRVMSGSVRASKTLSDGRRHVIDFLFPGDFFGFAASNEYDCTAEPLVPAMVQRYPRAQFELAARRDLDACNLLRGAAAASLAMAQARCVMLARLSSEERLATFILGMAGRAGGPDGMLSLPMTRADIGDYLGLTVETVSRTFTKFRARGWIHMIDAHDLVLADLGQLAKLSVGDATLRGEARPAEQGRCRLALVAYRKSMVPQSSTSDHCA